MSRFGSNPVGEIRRRWFEATPVGKSGVTERYIVYGESRRWLAGQLAFKDSDTVLDLGCGHGFLSFELASRTGAEVLGLDLLSGDQMGIASRSAKLGRLDSIISWIVGDARAIPCVDQSFDAVVSFLGLEDIHMTGRVEALSRTIREAGRVLKPRGTLALADNMFPECVHNDPQRLYWTIQRDELQAGLPSKKFMVDIIESSGLRSLKEAEYDPGIRLGEDEARVELMDIVEAKPFGKELDFNGIWKRYGAKIREVGLEYPSVLLLTARKP